jgi:hypothetical protein
MTSGVRVRPAFRRYALVALVITAAVSGAALIAAIVQAGYADDEAAAAVPDTSDPALKDFQARLQAYLDLRTSLAMKLKPLRPTDDSAALVAGQESLAAAIREARKDARQGDLIPAAIAERLRSIVVSDFKSRTREERAALQAEVPEGVVLAINRTFPAQAALPTVPPLLLKSLPVLPDNLQYRFANRHLIILDGDTQVIVDYIANVLPAT